MKGPMAMAIDPKSGLEAHAGFSYGYTARHVSIILGRAAVGHVWRYALITTSRNSGVTRTQREASLEPLFAFASTSDPRHLSYPSMLSLRFSMVIRWRARARTRNAKKK
jgi:hypothetical protein